MSSTTQQLMEKGLIEAPPFLRTNVHYETIMGSHAYGVADTSVRDKIPDYDVYGFAIPPKEMIFKHLTGYIDGFGTAPPGFEQYQKHAILEKPEGVPDGLTYEEICQELKKRGEI